MNNCYIKSRAHWFGTESTKIEFLALSRSSCQTMTLNLRGLIFLTPTKKTDTSEALAPGGINRLSGSTVKIPVTRQIIQNTSNLNNYRDGSMAAQGHQKMSGAFGRVRNVHITYPHLGSESQVIAGME